ncbi:Rha family transcriptional regulator [Adhaeribacter aquaticus]|uniref:Rha family transcriptional regulator n=1 Tax=Adhaeribacter aquaticus TaxID=299567 RepID=UPI000686B9F2|nr:phage regulatory protein/antirepressor Ant [Adhaeribacter aquaticus]
MEALVIQSAKGQDVTTSLIVAEVFGKEHKHVLRDIQNLSCSETFRQSNFGHTPYVHPQNGQSYPMYEMTKDGFSFLVMGYTGGKAAEFKEKFINEFNKREALLKNDDFILSRAFSIMTDRNKVLEEKVATISEQNHLLETTIKQQAPKVEYCEKVLDAVGAIATTVIASELGLKSANSLHKALKSKGIMWYVNGTWVLTAKYAGKGYTITKTHPYTDSLGQQKTSISTYWTEKGRAFLHNVFNPISKAS